MSNTPLTNALRSSIEDVLEKMFFVQSQDEFAHGAPETEIAARVIFDGRPSGALTLRMSAPAARSISADFLGAEEADLTDREVGEVVCELANMICGSVLSKVESTSTFRLGEPRLLSREEGAGNAEQDGSGRGDTGAVRVSNGALIVSMETEGTACQPAAEHVF